MTKVEVNHEICCEIGKVFGELEEVKPRDWISRDFPPEVNKNDREAMENVVSYFFFWCAQQFCFWYSIGEKYVTPMYAVKNGKKRKGSAFLDPCLISIYSKNPRWFRAENQKTITKSELEQKLSDDNGICPLPLMDERLSICLDSAKKLDKFKGSVLNLLKAASGYLIRDGKGLLEILEGFSGYRDSPFYKKSLLFVATMVNRPEKFFKIKDEGNMHAIIDYHLQRLALRTGAIEVIDQNLKRKLENRLYVTEYEEFDVRKATLDAFDIICKEAKKREKDPFEVDYYAWRARTYCPEMKEPDCDKCLIKDPCKGSRYPSYKRLFQPVFVTTKY